MKNMAVVSERGTVTIPEGVRKTAHIHPGDLIEFHPERNRIILRHLVVKALGEQNHLSDKEWNDFDKLVSRQLKKGEYKSYKSIHLAKQHSVKLMRKK